MRRLRLGIWIMALAGAVGSGERASAQRSFSAEVDLLELRIRDGQDHLAMESTYSFGRGPGQFVLKLDGGSDKSPTFDSFEVQALYSREVTGGLTLLGGARRDIRKGRDLFHAAAGVEAALSPWLDGEHYFYLTEDGDLTGGAQLKANWSLAQRVALEPRVDLSWSAQPIGFEGVGSGLTEIQAAARLRHALSPNFDAYVGVVHKQLLGSTRRIALAAGDRPHATDAVFGIGLRF